MSKPITALLFLQLSGCQQKPKEIIHFQADTIKQIVVYNRGDFSHYDTRTITDRDSIYKIIRTIEMAKWVDWQTINLKNTVKFCRIKIIDTKDKIYKFSYSVTGHSGDVLEYDYHYYQANDLYKFLK